jgi:hypothetical protein
VEEERDVKRIARRPARIVATGVVATAAAMILSGCALASPATIATPYPASDGLAGTITDPATNSTIKLENFLIVSGGQGQPGSLIGGVVNTGSTDVSVQISVDSGQDTVGQTTVSAAAGKLVQVGPSGTALTLASMPKGPGTLLTLVAKTAGGGSITFSVPVLAAQGYYATLSPSASNS